MNNERDLEKYDNTLHGNIDLFMIDIVDFIAEHAESLDIMSIRYEDIVESLKSVKKLLQRSALEELSDKQVKALDTSDKEFIIQPEDDWVLQQNIGKMLNLKVAHSEVKLENTLTTCSKRFCVAHNAIDTGLADHDTAIIQIPEDIYKFLVDNEYDADIIKSIIKCNFMIDYDFINVFRKILKVGKNFKNRNLLLNDNTDTANLDVISYVASRMNKLTVNDIHKRFYSTQGEKEYNQILDICKEINIHTTTYMNRVAVYNISKEDALRLGKEEKEKYKIYHNSDSGRNNIDLRNSFFAVIREEIDKQKDQE